MSDHLDVLRYLESKSQSAQLDFKDVLSLQTVLTKQEVTISIGWIFDRCKDISPDDCSVPQRATVTFLRFLAKRKLKSKNTLELVAWTCISLAFKVSGQVISVNDLISLMEARFNSSYIVATELFVTKQIMWDVNTPTLHEVLYLLLAPLPRLSLVLSYAQQFYKHCYSNYSVLKYGLVVLAISFILKAISSLSLQAAYKEFVELYKDQYANEIVLAEELVYLWE